MKIIPQKNDEDNDPLVLSIEAIQDRVIGLIKKPVETSADLERFFASWWCRHYNKPYKCEEIKSYSLEELIYEYYDVNYRNNPSSMEDHLKKDNEEDEAWLKNQMGEKYATKAEQDAELEKQRETLKAVHDAAEEESGEFNHTF